MKFAYVNANYQINHTGGGHVHMGQFIKNALALGHEIWVYPGNQYPGAKHIPTDHIGHIKTLRQMDALYIRLEKGSPDIVRWSVPLRRVLYGFPLVVWEFNTLPDELDANITKNKKGLLAKSSIGCDLGVCVSPALAKIVRDKLNIKNVISVSNGSDPELFRPDVPFVPRLEPFHGKFNVVWIGTLKESWHDLEIIGAAARLLWKNKKCEEIVFHIIGAGLSGFIAEMPPNVFYWGAEQYKRLPNWLAGIDVGLSLYKPSNSHFGSPLKVFDYMASGLAIVSTPAPFIKDLFAHLGQLDLIVPSGDSQALANVLMKLASEQDRVKNLGMIGRQLVIDKYNWRRAVSDTMDEMEILLGKRGRVLKA